MDVKPAKTTREAARLLGVTVRTLERWRRLGIGPAYTRFPGAVVYTEGDLKAWLRTRRVEPEGGPHAGPR